VTGHIVVVITELLSDHQSLVWQIKIGIKKGMQRKKGESNAVNIKA